MINNDYMKADTNRIPILVAMLIFQVSPSVGDELPDAATALKPILCSNSFPIVNEVCNPGQFRG